MNTLLWEKTFPRLGDLYLNSALDHPDNFFEHPNVSAALLRDPPETYLMETENDLSLMDFNDWNEFKRKAIPYVIAIDKWGWHTQLIERFHEAKGYAFLKKQGYSEVHFIQEKPNQKTPDFCGKGSQGVVILEAKRIRDSDEENNYITMPPGGEKVAQRVVRSLPAAFKEKLQDTIHRAKVQLDSPNVPAPNRRVLFLSIRLDLRCATYDAKAELDQFIKPFQNELEIVYQLENEFFH